MRETVSNASSLGDFYTHTMLITKQLMFKGRRVALRALEGWTGEGELERVSEVAGLVISGAATFEIRRSGAVKNAPDSWGSGKTRTPFIEKAGQVYPSGRVHAQSCAFPLPLYPSPAP